MSRKGGRRARGAGIGRVVRAIALLTDDQLRVIVRSASHIRRGTVVVVRYGEAHEWFPLARMVAR